MGKLDSNADALLVTQYRSGDVMALQKLVKRWHKRFCEKAFWITKDADASKDIAQDSWNSIISKIDSLKDPGSFQSWALRIVFTKAMDWLRLNQKHRNELMSYHKNLETVEEAPSDNEALKKALLVAIKSLSIEQQVVIQLFYVEDYTLNEMSGLLETSVGTVKSRLFHAREKLKEHLKHRHYEN
ncbi:RNA polymerase sigma factor [Flavobacteriaceae bacterium LMO-SS05]|jgi:RNA polymerase sigma-70 factor (ECF subfamily)